MGRSKSVCNMAGNVPSGGCAPKSLARCCLLSDSRQQPQFGTCRGKGSWPPIAIDTIGAQEHQARPRVFGRDSGGLGDRSHSPSVDWNPHKL